MNKEIFLEKAKQIHGYKYKYIELSEKITLKSKIKVQYRDTTYIQTANKHLLGKCPEKTTLKKTREEFIIESKYIWKDRFDYSNMEYKNSLSKIRIFDNNQGRFVEQIASLHLQGYEPNYYDADFFIIESNLISDFAYSYENCNYINKTTSVKINCSKHGDFQVKPIEHILYGLKCKKCDESTFTKKIKSILKKNNLNHLQQHKFDDCKNHHQLPFDFYIPSKRTCIEFDGIQHFQPVEHFGGIKAYEQLKQNDKIKNEYCEENYINLIRIRYDQIDRIEEILKNNILKNPL
jgi:very-short-patch-repair endonuclease